MPDAYRVVKLQLATQEVERIAFSRTPETFYHTRWCRSNYEAWDKLQRIIDRLSKNDEIETLRVGLEEVRRCTFSLEPPHAPPPPYCHVHMPLWPEIQEVCARALRDDEEFIEQM